MRHLFALLVVLLPLSAAVAGPVASLETELSEIGEDKLFDRATVALQVVDLASGEEVFARNADLRMSPASTVKVLTAATALKSLGPAYRFTTRIAADARPDQDGVVHGDVFVRGGGDPTLVVEKLWKLVLDLQHSGVSRIEGDLVFDESFFEPAYALPGWDKPADLERGPAYFPSLSALSLNFNTVAILVRPASVPGQAAVVQLETAAGDHVTLDASVKTGSIGARRSVKIQRQVTAEGGMAFRVTGSVPAKGVMGRYYRTVADPTAHFIAAFSSLLAKQGIEVSGSARRGVTPDAAVELVELSSLPLAVVLMNMNKFSNNFYAEQVLRTIGAEVEDAPGSTELGLAVVDQYLRSLGLSDADFSLVNGSGLSRDARLTAAALNTVLIDMDRDPRVGPEFAASLVLAHDAKTKI